MKSTSVFRPIDDLLSKVLDGTLDDREGETLVDLLRRDPQARQLYHDHIALHALFHWKESGSTTAEGEAFELDFDAAVPSEMPTPLSPHAAFSPTWHGMAGYFANHSIVLSYLLATVLVGFTLLALSAITISNHVEMAGVGTDIESRPRETLFVAKIKNMVDCTWSDPSTPVYVGSSVPLGREYDLTAGLVEIAYSSGATVILEGPCTYKVDSSAGGFLSVGKLTARVETKGSGFRGQGSEDRGQRSEVRGQKPHPTYLIPHPSPLFSVRTPTAIVTDLGTEFGVEVDKNGDTTSRVFQGAIKIQGLAAEAASGTTQTENILQENDSIRVSRVRETHQDQTAHETVRFTHPTRTPKFVRRLDNPPDALAEQSYIHAILADKPLGYWPLNEPANATRFRDLSGNGFHGYRMHDVTSGRPGPLSGNSRALELDGNGYIDVGRRDRFALANNFTVEAWVWIANPSALRGRIVSVGDFSEPRQLSGWGIGCVNRIDQELKDQPPFFMFTCYGHENRNYPNRIGMPLKEWFHLAFVFDKNNAKRVYLNGILWKTFPTAEPAATGPTWVSLGWGSNHQGEFWRGRLAHVAVFDQALSEKQIVNHYESNLKKPEGRNME